MQAGGEHHGRGNQDQRHRGPEVRLEQNQTDEHDDDDADRGQGVRHLVNAMHAPLEDGRDEEDRGELRELRRLHANPRQPEPPPGAIDGRAEQHGHERNRHEAEAAPDEDRLAIGAVVHLHQEPEHRQPERRPHRLLRQKNRCLSVPLQRHGRRGAVHHHDAESDQQDGGDEQNVVRLQLTSHVTSARPQGRPLKLNRGSPETLPGRRITIAVSSQQSSVGLGPRHQLRRPGQPAFPAAGPQPQHRLTTAHCSRTIRSTSSLNCRPRSA